MEIFTPEETIAQAKSLVTSFLREDLEAVHMLLLDHPDPALAMALGNLAAATVRALAESNENDPVELWSQAMYATALVGR